jgi:hypothetical protein
MQRKIIKSFKLFRRLIRVPAKAHNRPSQNSKCPSLRTVVGSGISNESLPHITLDSEPLKGWVEWPGVRGISESNPDPWTPGHGFGSLVRVTPLSITPFFGFQSLWFVLFLACLWDVPQQAKWKSIVQESVHLFIDFWEGNGIRINSLWKKVLAPKAVLNSKQISSYGRSVLIQGMRRNKRETVWLPSLVLMGCEISI